MFIWWDTPRCTGSLISGLYLGYNGVTDSENCSLHCYLMTPQYSVMDMAGDMVLFLCVVIPKTAGLEFFADKIALF